MQNVLGENKEISVTIFHRNFLFAGKGEYIYMNVKKLLVVSVKCLQWKEQLFHSQRATVASCTAQPLEQN